jgi:hypothetical protein
VHVNELQNMRAVKRAKEAGIDLSGNAALPSDDDEVAEEAAGSEHSSHSDCK